MSECRELINLQFGHYSNFVGAHFWNIQELSFDYTGKKQTDVDHDVLYREGESFGKVTYTPRLLLADLNGALGSLSTSGGLSQCFSAGADQYSDDWLNVVKTEEQKIEKNDYLKYINNEGDVDETVIEKFDFESEIKTWTDYLFPRFHSRTISLIDQYKHNNAETPFETYHSGLNMWKNAVFSDTFTDNIRRYSEECGNFQGFQICLDSTDGFSGLANNCIQYLTDEYSSKSIFSIPLIPSHFSDNSPQTGSEIEISAKKDSARVVNLALTYTNLFENSSLFVPMSCGEKGWRKPGKKREFFNLEYNSKLDYHSSAILATALDTLSLGYRLKRNAFTLADLCSDMSGYGRKMAAAYLGMPFFMEQKHDLIEHLDKVDFPLWTPITPVCKIAKEKIFQYVTVRGIPEDRLKRPLKSADNQIQMAAYSCNSVKEMFDFYFHCNYYATATHVTTSPNGVEVKMPFPKLFHDDLNKNGFVKEFAEDEGNPESVPAIASLSNGNFIHDTLDSLCREAKRIKFAKLHKFKEEGLEQDDLVECLDKLSEYQDNYKESFEL